MIRDLTWPALSVRQPWAGLLMGGWKGCENRTWNTSYRGPLIIHAGQIFEEWGLWRAYDLGVPDDALAALAKPARGYLGLVELTDTHPAQDCLDRCGGWGEPGDGVFHWVVRAPRLFAEPVPGRGWLGLYRKDIPDAAYAAAADATGVGRVKRTAPGPLRLAPAPRGAIPTSS